MKPVLLLLVLLVHHSFAQYPRRANVAIIETDDLKGYPFYRECADVIMAEGYTIDPDASMDNLIITRPVEIHELPLKFKLKVVVEGPYASIRGFVLDDRDFASLGLNAFSKDWEDAAFRSFQGSTWRLGFEEVVTVVEKIRANVKGKVRWDRWQNFQ